jgi:hypothetical protein
MTGKMVASLLGVAVLAGGVGGGAGWMLGLRSERLPPSNVIEMLPDHSDFAETCRQQGARVEVAVTSIEFDGQGNGVEPVTDATLAKIADEKINSSKSIRSLAIRNAQITDAGLAHLEKANFDYLEVLELVNCPDLTDAGLEHLKNKTWLRTLIISGCGQITKQGTDALQANFKNHADRRSLLVTYR